MLDFDEIKREAIKANKGKIVKEVKAVVEYEFSEKELKQIEAAVKNIEQQIPKFSKEGKFKFLYDCSSLAFPVFNEIAIKFKTANPRFYVETHSGPQMIIIDWTGKNEV